MYGIRTSGRDPGAARRRAPVMGAALLAVMLAPATSATALDDATSEPAGAAASGAAPVRRNTDPLERLNRATFAFNDALDRMLARPTARLYRAAVPEVGRNAVTKFVSNLEYPTTAINSALQGKFREAGQGAARFVVNATVGIGGLMDPATEIGLPRLDEDFGQTLGRWGVPSGPYLMFPFLGPGNFRDGPARFVDRYTNARRYIGAGTTEYALFGLTLEDRRAQLLAADAALANAFDPYALVRDAYQQRREFLVRDGNVPDESYDDLYEPPDDAADAAAPVTGTPGSDTGPTAPDSAVSAEAAAPPPAAADPPR
jgi:phospholipid-binding lipoprotein MlaA